MTAGPSRAFAATATAAVVLVLVASLVPPDSGVSPLVVRIAQFVLAGAAAYLLDDAALVLTTVTPLGLWRRRLPRLAWGSTVLAVAWAAVLLLLRWQESLPPVRWATGELVVLCLAAMAASAVISGRGEPEPGSVVGPVVVLLGITAVFAEQVLRTTIFVPWDGSGGFGVRVAWVAAGVIALTIVVGASRDPAGRRRRRMREDTAPQIRAWVRMTTTAHQPAQSVGRHSDETATAKGANSSKRD
jgi:hypothetical protein